MSSVSAVQPSNACMPMVSMLLGRVSVARELHWENVPALMVVRPLVLGMNMLVDGWVGRYMGGCVGG